jgi:hypothetical protein
MFKKRTCPVAGPTSKTELSTAETSMKLFFGFFFPRKKEFS